MQCDYLISSKNVQYTYSSPSKWHTILSQLLTKKVRIDFMLLHCFFVKILSFEVRLRRITYITLLKNFLYLQKRTVSE